ncbi:MAG: tRNA pseudouridine(38-40) synthase TruA [Thermoplasmata archaeon]|nr:tRNA pseudouridine(38-40) synthase TruA [Thermoplasmata archaeon]
MTDIRLALKFAYNGTNFHGSQRQVPPENAVTAEITTVEGEILQALNKINVDITPEIARLQVASRTDSGVSALGNVIAITTTFDATDLITSLNANLNDCWFYGFARIDEDFKPRWAQERWYRYYLPSQGLDSEKVAEGAKIFRGEHNFRNFANREVENPVREIRDIQVNERGDYLVLDFRAESFIWNQLRRIIKALELIGKNKKELSEVQSALANPDEDFDFGVAPAENLILMDVIYDFEFEIDDKLYSDIKQNLETQIYPKV